MYQAQIFIYLFIFIFYFILFSTFGLYLVMA